MKTVNEAIEVEVVEEVEVKESLVKTYAKSFGKGMLIGAAVVVVAVAVSALFGKDEEDEAIENDYHPDAITAEFESATVEEVE